MFRFFCVLSFVLFFTSCKEDKKQNSSPIILGDSSTIVTETDPNYLTDFVDDIQLRTVQEDTLLAQIDSAHINDSIAANSKTMPDMQGKGLKIPFKEVTVFIPGIETKTYTEQHPEKESGVSYEIVRGELQGNQLQFSGATITEIEQRYITNVIAKTDLGILELDALSNLTDWEPLKGSGNTYTITGLDKPDAKRVSAAQIRSAVSRAAKNKRMSRQNIRKWESAVRKVKSVNQSPLSVVVRSVMWKIEGKDENGKFFHKQVRIDFRI